MPRKLTGAELWAPFTNEWLQDAVSKLQGVQKRHKLGSPVWEEGSRRLAPLFAELARRQREGLL